jgi:hypothetical protein
VKKLLGILGILIALTACAAPIEGVVVGKDVDPGRTESYWTTERNACGLETYTTTETSNGKSRQVRKTRTRYCDRRVQRTRNVPPSWDLNIRKDDGTQQWVGVSQAKYRSVNIGDRVNTGDPREHIGPAR